MLPAGSAVCGAPSDGANAIYETPAYASGGRLTCSCPRSPREMGGGADIGPLLELRTRFHSMVATGTAETAPSYPAGSTEQTLPDIALAINCESLRRVHRPGCC